MSQLFAATVLTHCSRKETKNNKQGATGSTTRFSQKNCSYYDSTDEAIRNHEIQQNHTSAMVIV